MNTSTIKTDAARDAGQDYNRARAICSCRHHAFPCAKCEALKPIESTEDRDAILAEMFGPCGASEEIARIAARKALAGKGDK